MLLERNIKIWALLVGIIVLFTLINISTASTFGKLATASVYDDCVYLLDAYQRYIFESVKTPFDALLSFASNPPHAPLQTATALLGYAVFSGEEYGPYTASVWILSVYVFFIYSIFSGHISKYSSFFLTVTFMFVPAAGAIITEFRPDMAAGLLFAIAAYRLIGFDYKKNNSTNSLLVGFICAIAIIMKPSAIVITVPMLGLAGIIGIFASKNADRRKYINSISLILLSFSIFFVPFLYLWGKQTYEYVVQALITNKDIWDVPGTWMSHMMFNSVGSGGSLALGIFLLIGLVSIACDIGFFVATKVDQFTAERPLAIHYYVWVSLIYFGIGMTANGSVYQGCFFYFPFVVATVMSVSRNLTRLKEAASMRLAASTTIAAVLFLPAGNLFQDMSGRLNDHFVLNEVTKMIVDNVASIPLCGNTTPVYATMGPNPVAAETVALSVARISRVKITPSNLLFIRTSSEAIEGAISSNFLFVPGAKLLAESRHLPGTAFGAVVAEALQNDEKWDMYVLRSDADAKLFVRRNCEI